MAGREISLQALRTARRFLLGMVFLYVWIGEKDGPAPRAVNPLLRIALYVLAVSVIATTLWLRHRELRRAQDSLAREPGNVTALRRWRTIQLVVLACLLAVPLYGFVLRFQGGTFVQALPFYLVGSALLFFFPLHEATERHTRI
jgi:hypothetical protein